MLVVLTGSQREKGQGEELCARSRRARLTLISRLFRIRQGPLYAASLGLLVNTQKYEDPCSWLWASNSPVVSALAAAPQPGTASGDESRP